MAGERQTGPDTEMPDGLYYSERGLWDAQAPTQAEVRMVLPRLARVRADTVAELLRFFEDAGMTLTMREVRHAANVLAGQVAGPEFGCDAESGETA